MNDSFTIWLKTALGHWFVVSLHCLETTFSHELESQVAVGCLLTECFLPVRSTKARLAQIFPH